MCTTITFHRLFSSSVSNLNRDGIGRPKHALVGDVNRGRISSQSCKHTMRQEFTALSSDICNAIRTKDIKTLMHEALLAEGATDSEAELLATKFSEVFVKNEDCEKETEAAEATDNKNNTLLAFSKNDYQHFAKVFKTYGFNPSKVIDSHKEFKSPVLNALKATHGLEALDVALFGRMVAKASELGVDGALRVSHAVTTHKVKIESDYFTAVADAVHGVAPQGAGMLGNNYFNSGVYYQCLTLTVEDLIDNMGGDADVDKVVELLTRVLATGAFPKGRLNTYNSPAHVDYMQVVIQKGGMPLSADFAFEKPVSAGENGGYRDNSIETLKNAIDTALTYDDYAVYKQVTVKDDADENIKSLKAGVNKVIEELHNVMEK